MGTHGQEEEMRTLTCPEPERALFSACLCVNFSVVLSLDLPLRVDRQHVCPLHSLPPTVPTLVGGAAGCCPNHMTCSGEAVAVIREEGLSPNLCPRKGREIRV